jgi:aspartate ammonia-lyase
MFNARMEEDLLGKLPVPEGVLWGIHSLRASQNFSLLGQPLHPAIISAFGDVKLACATVNMNLGFWKNDPEKADAIVSACREMAGAALTDSLIVDALQGGAGTSANMNANEVLANRALQILKLPPGAYTRVHPLEDLNLHQSTNDVFPTALRIAAIRLLCVLETKIVALQEAFQEKEKQFAHVVKVARTEFQDAVLITVGREMGAYAEAVNRDRWRLSKCHERLRVVNLGGTAVGTGLAAPRQFIFQVVDTLREITSLNLARAENLVDATQNADVFVEVSGLLKAFATTLLKISCDLRFLSSGPDAGIGELILPARQEGSSIMPGKVNPVIPEAVSQAAMMVIGNDAALTLACASGHLELNPFLPLVAHLLLQDIDLLARAADILSNHCIKDLAVNEERCRAHVENSTAAATALLPAIGHSRAVELATLSRSTGQSIKTLAVQKGYLTAEQFDQLVSPESVCRLGHPLPEQP